ncbi:ABC transporter ATP-binding protein [Thermicanus aegyptius]|uniref:Daunorubicin resistance ATP-binding protein drrA n=1 Tax=Candidatus Carbonibacillus altaicus TaxID=2163959 RepID=A0A2R6Y2M8_9BACL|nr:ABC transporter ATP-binding protein [Thermicanus aegyptius]PTQ56903.1 MAG: Daunorubicin resistance ATP-binding protein drrA [Candidatus Carbobacillus altaicus]
MLMVEDLVKLYPGGRKALNGFSLHLHGGERLILLGPNGAGKTTLIKCMTGLIIPDGGRIIMNRFDVVKYPEYASKVTSVVFEEVNNSYAYLTVYENLLYFSLLNGISLNEAHRKAERVLKLVGLQERSHSLAQSLSRGMKQKLAIAISLMKDAPILILDEPTLGLDVESQHHMRHLLSDNLLPASSMLITTHDIPFAYAVGTRFIIMKQGEIVWEGTKADISTAAALESQFLSMTAEAN